MTIHVELTPEAEAQLAAAAGVRGIPIETYAGYLLQEALAPGEIGAPSGGQLTLETLDEFTRKFSEGSENLPVLTPEANERASYYGDRG